jgi:hypothetical protein
MFKFILAVAVAATIYGVYHFSSDASKARAKKAGTALVESAADNATAAALEQTDKAVKSVNARWSEVKKQNDKKFQKK